jgi:hypothetical protein
LNPGLNLSLLYWYFNPLNFLKGDYVECDSIKRQAWLDRVAIGEISAKAGMMGINGSRKDTPAENIVVRPVQEKAEEKVEKSSISSYVAKPLGLPAGLVQVGSDEGLAGLIALPAQVFRITKTGESRACSRFLYIKD